MRTFIISDTHFNHKKLMEYCGRPENFNDLIIENWNKLVMPEDKVIHLGDVILGNNSQLSDILGQLNGKKILCRGNHDHESGDWYEKRGFSFVCDYYIYQDIAFSHSPLTPLPYRVNRQHGGTEVFEQIPVRLNIHGHFHNNGHRDAEFEREGKKNRYYDWQYFDKNRDKYRLIQIEDDLRPFTLEEIMPKNID